MRVDEHACLQDFLPLSNGENAASLEQYAQDDQASFNDHALGAAGIPVSESLNLFLPDTSEAMAGMFGQDDVTSYASRTARSGAGLGVFGLAESGLHHQRYSLFTTEGSRSQTRIQAETGFGVDEQVESQSSTGVRHFQASTVVHEVVEYSDFQLSWDILQGTGEAALLGDAKETLLPVSQRITNDTFVQTSKSGLLQTTEMEVTSEQLGADEKVLSQDMESMKIPEVCMVGQRVLSTAGSFLGHAVVRMCDGERLSTRDAAAAVVGMLESYGVGMATILGEASNFKVVPGCLALAAGASLVAEVSRARLAKTRQGRLRAGQLLCNVLALLEQPLLRLALLDESAIPRIMMT
eukprot:g43997.t1